MGDIVQARPDAAHARLAVSRHACDLFWAKGVAATSGDEISAAAGLSTRTIWRYFRSKESCVEPVLATSADRFVAIMSRWPDNLSLSEHLAANAESNPLSDDDMEDERRSMRIATLSLEDPTLRTSYLMVHDYMEKGLLPILARRLNLDESDLTVKLYAAAVTGAFRVIDEVVSVEVIVDKKKYTQQEALALMDRAITEATYGRLGGPVTR
ncbi:TetR/AcrR family transcriptional regulator [Mycobacterium sp. 236(2023)]|uniref:TetR/AcrR family transcriptional regulator n=1 Tax=Mycobacterium sp. 236(2023) TaxID=3038163 RepID=UPI0024158BA9|nr:TetR/AcrR family transcriptional regulator [Mycobacterium sp. 236(2023)]MDG4668699.1 helix-turn-helix domain containing protein [Mycobacterium sp. 236(2023)]